MTVAPGTLGALGGQKRFLPASKGLFELFARIRANVYDIFRTVLKVAEGSPDGETLFAAKLTEIPSVWQKAHDQAERHGDAATLCIERIKLDAAAEVRAKFETIRRDAT